MEKVFINGLMDENMRASIFVTASMVGECLSGQMVLATKVHG